MKYFFFYILMLGCLFSCGETVDKPKNVLSKSKMSEIIADFAINEQNYNIDPKMNLDNATRYILKTHKTNGDIFTESYRYYLSKPDVMKEILDDSQDIIREKDPKASDYIDKKLDENKSAQDKPNQLNKLPSDQ